MAPSRPSRRLWSGAVRGSRRAYAREPGGDPAELRIATRPGDARARAVRRGWAGSVRFSPRYRKALTARGTGAPVTGTGRAAIR